MHMSTKYNSDLRWFIYTYIYMYIYVIYTCHVAANHTMLLPWLDVETILIVLLGLQ